MPKSEIEKVIADSSLRHRIQSLPGSGLTAYQIGLSLMDAPVATVSEHFAADLTSDIMQTEHFAPHLQPLLRNGIVGINNGPFVGFSPLFPKRGRHTVSEIAAIKRGAREALLKVLDTYVPSERFGTLTWKGESILNLPDEVPILVMSGYPTPETIASGQKMGATHFIAKPFTPEELSAAVARALGGRQKE
jgi:hypothetical protein